MLTITTNKPARFSFTCWYMSEVSKQEVVISETSRGRYEVRSVKERKRDKGPWIYRVFGLSEKDRFNFSDRWKMVGKYKEVRVGRGAGRRIRYVFKREG